MHSLVLGGASPTRQEAVLQSSSPESAATRQRGDGVGARFALLDQSGADDEEGGVTGVMSLGEEEEEP